jgi:hypothetical protein
VGGAWPGIDGVPELPATLLVDWIRVDSGRRSGCDTHP